MSAPASWRSGFGFPPLDQWKGFLLAITAVVMGAAAFDFAAAPEGLPLGLRALEALRGAGELVAIALVGGLVVWGGIRLVKGEDAPEPKESILWSACLIAILVTAAKLLN